MYGSKFEKLLATGDSARRIGLFAQAARAYREALRLAEFQAPPTGDEYTRDHLPAAEASVKLGRVYESMQYWDAADRSYQDALRIFGAVEGEEYFELSLARDRVAVPGGTVERAQAA